MTLQDVLDEGFAFLVTWAPFLLAIAAGVLVGYVFQHSIVRLLRRVTAASKTEIDDIVLKSVHPFLIIAISVTSVWIMATFWAEALPPAAIFWLGRLSYAIVVFLAALMTTRILRGMLQYRARKQPHWIPAANLGSRTLSVVVYIVGFLVVVRAYGVDITPLLTSLGLAGLAVALALQDTLSNFFAGVWIQTGRVLQPGHFVRVEDASIEGYVVEVGWRTTQIRTLPNNIVAIPNAILAKSTVTDYHLPVPRMSLLVPISVGYEADPDRIEKILVEETLEAAKTTPGLLKEPAPFVRFIPGFGDYALQFTLICQVAEFTDQYLAQHEIRRRILARFRVEGIRIPYPTREVVAVPGTRADVGKGPVPADSR